MSSGQVAGPTQTASDELKSRRWVEKPWIARAIRLAIFLFPLVVSVLASLWMSRNFPPEEVRLNKWVWWIGLAIGAMFLVRGLEKLLSKLTGRDLLGWTITDSPMNETDPVGNFSATFSSLTDLAPNNRLALWLFGRADELQANDDLFLYDRNGLLVDYIAWGDDEAADTEIGTRPPLATWNLWDPSHEEDLSFTDNASLATTANSPTAAPVPPEWSQSRCWERTLSGDAQDNGCPNARTTVHVDVPGTEAENHSRGHHNTN